MKLSQQIAGQFREMYLNGNWVATNLREQLKDVDWQRATKTIGDHNSIAAIAFHINYYVAGLVNVLEGGQLEIKDKYSFDMQEIRSEEEWQALKNQMWRDGERFAELVEKLDDDALSDPFIREEYGNNYRNLMVILEHSYYHLGQIGLLKKLIP